MSLRRFGAALSWLFALVGVALVFAEASRAAVEITEFEPPGGASAIAPGPEGSMWFSSSAGVGQVMASGEIRPVAVPPGHSAYRLSSAPNGDLWAQGDLGRLYRVAVGGGVTEFEVPRSPSEGTGRMAVGADGNLWFTGWSSVHRIKGSENQTGKAFIGRFTPGEGLTRFELPIRSARRTGAPAGATLGPDGNVWFVDPSYRGIGKISPSGQITQYQLEVVPYDLATGSDGSLWLAYAGGIGRVSAEGELQPVPLRARAREIAVGPEGSVWFTGDDLSVGRLTPSGQLSRFELPSGWDAWAIAIASDGGVWTTTSAKLAIYPRLARIAPGSPGVEFKTFAAQPVAGRVDIELACGGSSSDCVGEISAAGGKAAYSIPPESSARIAVDLPPGIQRLLSRERFLRIFLGANVDGGVGDTATLVLNRSNPMKGVPRRGHPVVIPLPEGISASGLALGWDKRLWLGGAMGELSRISSEGVIESWKLPKMREIRAMVAGPRRSMWFLAEMPGGWTWNALAEPRLGRISASGHYAELVLPGLGRADDLALGGDGNLWITRSSAGGGEIDRVTPAGRVTRYRTPDAVGPIAAAPGRGVWFTMDETSLGRIGTNGNLERFKLPGRGYIPDITMGPNGSVWFARWGQGTPPSIGRITAAGGVKTFRIHPPGRPSGVPAHILFGPDGNLWFSEFNHVRIGKMTPKGKVTHLRRGGEGAYAIAVGPEGNMWFLEPGGLTVASL